MAYDVVISPRAQKEIENAIDFYALYSSSAPAKFIDSLGESYMSLEDNPFFGVRYLDIRALKIKKFPYVLYFVVKEQKKLVRILSCFHSKMNPQKRPSPKAI